LSIASFPPRVYEAMTNRALGGSINHAAPSPPIEAMIEGASDPTTTIPKTEDSPAPSRSTSLGAEGIGTENIEGNGPTTAGRKRKLNSTSSRGVANLTPDQLAKKRANDRQAQRAIRERTKSHIETLEQQVRDLASQKPVLDLQAALQHNERIRAENRELRQGLKSVIDIIQPLLARPEASGRAHRVSIIPEIWTDINRYTFLPCPTEIGPANIPYPSSPRDRPHKRNQPGHDTRRQGICRFCD
jgi:hypothetical protein